MRPPVLVATRSHHKLREIRAILAKLSGPDVVDLPAAGVQYEPQEEEIEVHDTFGENARRRMVIRCNTQDRDLASAVAEIERRIEDQVELPVGYFIAFVFVQFMQPYQRTYHRPVTA